MTSENETVEDIVKEKRDTADEAELKGKNIFAFDLAKMLREEANRIEAAHKREMDAVLKDRDEMYKSEQETVAKTKAWFDDYQHMKREVKELRECLKEAIREKCPFTWMSCKHGEQCDYECGTYKWRKFVG